MGRGDVKVDGESVACPLPTDATLASAFVYLRDHILREGKIVTDVRIDDDPVTWEDGSPGGRSFFRRITNCRSRAIFPFGSPRRC